MPGQSSGLRFSPSAAVISGAETGVSDHCDLSDPVGVRLTRQPQDSDGWNVDFFQCLLSSKALSLCFQPSLLPDWSLLTLSFAGRLYKGHCLLFFINNQAPLTPQLDNENHRLGRSGETFLVSANVAAWWHINVIYQRVYVAGLVGHFYAPLEQGCCVSA